jgi:hypothetical protein
MPGKIMLLTYATFNFIIISQETSCMLLDSADTSLYKHICPQRDSPELDSSEKGGGVFSYRVAMPRRRLKY